MWARASCWRTGAETEATAERAGSSASRPAAARSVRHREGAASCGGSRRTARDCVDTRAMRPAHAAAMCANAAFVPAACSLGDTVDDSLYIFLMRQQPP